MVKVGLRMLSAGALEAAPALFRRQR